MNKFITFILAIAISGCTSYKVVPDGELKFAPKDETLSIKKENEWPEGAHCFEPLLYVLTLGIIPTHCIDTYTVSAENGGLGKVKVTSMQGWVPLLLAPFSVWQYGFGTEVEIEKSVKKLVEVEE